MSEGEPHPSAGASNTTIDAVPENITLRIVILAHGSGREDDLYLVLSLDTTLGELKSRIQESLPQRPSPNHQRIIYQGRGLDNANEPLRNILRQDPRAGNSSYVLHLVIRQSPAGSQPVPPVSAVPHQTPIDTTQHVHQPQVQVQVPRGQAIQPSPQDAQMRIHQQIHMQQLLRHRAQLAQMQQSHPNLHNNPPDQARQMPQMIPNLAAGQPQGVNQAHNSPAVGSTQDPTTDNLPSHTQIHAPTSIAGGPIPNLPNPQLPQIHAAHPGHVPMQAPFASTTQIRTAVDPNGQHTRTVVNGGPTSTTTMTFRITGLNPPNPLDRPSSAPGSSPSADSDPTNRVINPMPGNVQIHPPPPPIPLGFPFPPGLQLPFPMPGMMPLANNPFQQITSHNPASQPMAWLLSSPTGPQGIVYAPGHGFFSTTPVTPPSQLQPTPTVPDSASQTVTLSPQQAQLVVRPQTGTAAPPAPQPGARPQPPAGGLPVAPQPRAAARARARPNNDQNEILQFIINRGWLFLRLYMFVFVFSESGTWRRILMIGAIIIYCALPQRNPLTNALQVVRRHFDNLIGPPTIPQRQPQQPQANNQNPGQGGATQPADAQAGSSASTQRRTTPMPTPEETARRLLEQQNRRNPNPVIDALYRFEQGMVLFLASLVPGVGERHVRAREEARRIIQEEEQRRITDAQQQAQPTASDNGPSAQTGGSEPKSEELGRETEGGPLPEGWKSATQLHEGTSSQQATSSGVDRTGQTGEGVRSRTAPSEE